MKNAKPVVHTDNQCKSCKYHGPCPFWGEGLCENPLSNYYMHYTADEDYCQRFEEKDE